MNYHHEHYYLLSYIPLDYLDKEIVWIKIKKHVHNINRIYL